MSKMTKLPNNYYELDYNEYSYLNPEKIYIPIRENLKFNFKLLSQVKTDTLLYTNENNEPTYSTISGTITKTDFKYNNKQLTPTIEIVNNYKEEKKKIASTKDISKLSKEEVINLLYQKGGISHKDQTYLYKFFQQEIKCLIIKLFDDELYGKTNEYLAKINEEEILTTIEALQEIFSIEHVILLIKDYNNELISIYQNLLSNYPKVSVKIIPNYYPTNIDNILTEEVINTNSIKDIKVLDAKDILDIKYIIKRKLNITEKYISIINHSSKKIKIIKTKIGTLLTELLDKYEENYQNIGINNPYNKIINNLNNTIITIDTECIHINLEENREYNCIKCGKCYKVCPLGLDPLNIDKTKCNKCGLCSILCPSNIDLIKVSDKNE